MRRVVVKLAACAVLAAAPAVAGNWNVPTTAKGIKNPVARTAQTAVQGKAVYTEKCVECHGKESAGDGTRSRVEYDLRDIVGQLTDGELYWKITHGVGRMPSYAGVLSDEQRWQVINYLRDLTEARAMAAKSGY
jgi:mono/diheme cytochrome c family protein